MFSCKAVLVAFMLLFILAFSVRNVNGFSLMIWLF
jgi:hypothetical protein